MRLVFADTLYWIALMHRKDQWHPAAVRAARGLADCRLGTTDEVLTEVLNTFAEAGPFLRSEAITLVNDLRRDALITIHAQSRQTFDAGCGLYAGRLDKGYSLTGCISMETMRREGISEVLTAADHFAREGFTKLL